MTIEVGTSNKLIVGRNDEKKKKNKPYFQLFCILFGRQTGKITNIKKKRSRQYYYHRTYKIIEQVWFQYKYIYKLISVNSFRFEYM